MGEGSLRLATMVRINREVLNNVKLGNDPNARTVEARLIYSSKTTGAFLVQKNWWIFATYIDRLNA
jgi:hypothetical protein